MPDSIPGQTPKSEIPQDETLQSDNYGLFATHDNSAWEAETTEKVRTRETEIQANIEFWKAYGKEVFGIEVDEQEIRSAIEALPEKEGFDWLIAIPKGLKLSDIGMNKWSNNYACQSYTDTDLVKLHLPGSSWEEHLRIQKLPPAEEKVANHENYRKTIQAEKDSLNAIKMPRNAQETYAIAAHYSADPDEGSYKDDPYEEPFNKGYKSSLEWEQTGRQFMSPMEWMIADMRFYADNHKNLDTSNNHPKLAMVGTLCAGSRTPSGKVPVMSRSAPGAYLTTKKPEDRTSFFGVREVITKDTKVEDETTE